MITEDLCTRCSHLESEHCPGLYGTICYGRFWADERKAAPCQCDQFRPPVKAEAAA
jgi:hypothetical protein